MKSYGNNSRIIQALSYSAVLLSVFTAGCGSSGNSNNTGGAITGPPDYIAPNVTSMSPSEDTTDVPTNITLTATFSEAMIPIDINTENFRLTDGENYIQGTVSFDATSKIATFKPIISLTPNLRYTATVITGIRDLSSNPLTTDFAWCFVTGATEDNTAPAITTTSATFESNTKKISATFNKEMNSSTMTTANFIVTGNGNIPIPGTVTYAGKTAMFTPQHRFTLSTTYTATIMAGVMDLAGNTLQNNATWNFTTSALTDITLPLISTSPSDGMTNVAIDTIINVIFNEPMDPDTITSANFVLTESDGTPVIGTVMLDVSNNTATFTRINHLVTPVDFHLTPVNNLEPNIMYIATLTTGVRDMAGNALANDMVWSFTTAP